MRSILLLVLLNATSLVHAAPNFALSDAPGPYGVGLRVIRQYDYSRAYRGRFDRVTGQGSTRERARPIQTLIWYPAKRTGTPVHYIEYLRIDATEEVFDLSSADVDQIGAGLAKSRGGGLTAAQLKEELGLPMRAVLDAPSVPGRFPLIVYSPGLGGNGHENADLFEYLASYGYVVISAADVGTFGREQTHDMEGIDTHVGDIEFLIGYAHSLPEADTAHIAVMGFSWGAISSVLAAARDSRIRAIVSLDGSVRYYPDLVAQATDVTPERLQVPFLNLISRPQSLEDLSGPDNPKVDFSKSLIPRLKYSDLYTVTLYPMEHPDFVSGFLRLGSDAAFTEYSRAEVSVAFAWAAGYVRNFLNAYLKSDAASLAFLNSGSSQNGVPAHLLSVEVHRSAGSPPTRETFAEELGKRGFEHAKDVYEEMQKKDPAFMLTEEALAWWGYWLQQAQKNKEAIEIYKLATIRYPASGNALNSLAGAYEANQDKSLAIDTYKRILEVEPGNVRALQHLKALGAPDPDIH